MKSPVPTHSNGVIIISLLAALIVFIGNLVHPVAGAVAAFVFIYGLLERERQQIMNLDIKSE